MYLEIGHRNVYFTDQNLVNVLYIIASNIGCVWNRALNDWNKMW